jgi:hypothetical protein
LHNIEPTPQVLDIWVRITNPWGYWQYPYNSVENISLASLQSTSFIKTQFIPSSWSAGTYIYRIYAGIHPNVVYGENEFDFQKFSADDESKNSESANINDPVIDSLKLPRREIYAENPAPNPFNFSTAISYQLSAFSTVSLKVYDTTGRLVTILVDGMQDVGTHEVLFDGSKLTSGLYFVRMQAGDYTDVKKLMLIK